LRETPANSAPNALPGQSRSRPILMGVEMTADCKKVEREIPAVTTRAESLDYFRTISAELATMARACELPVLAHLYDMAAEEVALELRRAAS
jgi:hypothetical protein